MSALKNAQDLQSSIRKFIIAGNDEKSKIALIDCLNIILKEMSERADKDREADLLKP